MINSVNHIALVAKEIERLSRFYEEILLLTPAYKRSRKGRLESVWFDLNGILLMIEQANAPTSSDVEDPPLALKATPKESSLYHRKNGGLHLIAFHAKENDRPRILATLEQYSISVDDQSEYTLYCRDPEGNRIAFSTFDKDEYLKNQQIRLSKGDSRN